MRLIDTITAGLNHRWYALDRYYHRWYAHFAEPVFPRFSLSSHFAFSLLFTTFFSPFCFCLFYLTFSLSSPSALSLALYFLSPLLLLPSFLFPFWGPFGANEAIMLVWSSPIRSRRGQTRQQGSYPSSSWIQNPVGVLPRRRLGGVICFAVPCFACSTRLCLLFGTNDDGIDYQVSTPLLQSSETVRR